jgi:soluble lytic murein transglycosylase-like protein
MKRVVLLALCALTCASVFGEIAIFTGGRTMKIEAYAAHEETMDLVLESGGRLTVPMTRIERIIDDEVIVPVEEVQAATSAFPQRSWGFSDASQPFYSSRFNPIIVEAARKFDVDAALVSAVIKIESDYNPKVVSHKGARGLMQLMPATAKRFGVTDSHDPAANIYGGTRYLRWLLDHFEGNIDRVVAAYNAGEGNVRKYDGIPPFRETVRYVQKVARHFNPAVESPSLASSAR